MRTEATVAASATVPDPRPQAPAFLVALAAREAAGNCDSHPDSAVYLRTTRQTAEAMAGDGVDSDQPVYLVQLRGHFVDYGAHGIYRRRDDFPRGTAVTFNVDARTHGILDFGIGGPAAGLPQLGEVHDFTAELIVVPTWPLPKLC